ncbi:glycoside hydrolase family 19 protein [Rhizobium halophytocola]|uniref:Chitinase n=1 Tax=Rhizobium halophytocola TaxID=735519 RepID=A0ABS4E5M6_9HYPH|nr:glycoside hydrolase family 19 protein [Rhizobium halophytocola]MBP1853219.1 putative chitinase [Rhizobium halophytocola]
MRRLTSSFFDSVRASLFAGRLSQPQVDGLNAIADGYAGLCGADDPCRLAYVLATAFHETGGRMMALRETGASSDAEAVARLDRAYAAGRLPQVSSPYWRADTKGRCWFGRGLVQITHAANYRRVGAAIGADLAGDPQLALRTDIAVQVLVIGMRDGLFTGRRLRTYFDGGAADWVGARRIVNGTDRAELIAGYGRAFRAALDG